MLQGPAFGMPSFDEVKADFQRSDAVLLDRHGEVIHELRVDPNSRKLEWAGLADISPALVKSVVRSEDKRFYDHHGVDWTALSSAAMGNIFGSRRRGASTITMQLASMIDDCPEIEKGTGVPSVRSGSRSRPRKRSKQSWTKDQILEAYLNLVSYRGELQGIAAASRGIFDKDAGGLDEAESLFLPR